MEIEEKIEKAKAIAKKDHEDRMKEIGAFNPHLKREWVKHKMDNGGISYALKGTPDKAFVHVTKDWIVRAIRADGKILKEFK